VRTFWADAASIFETALTAGQTGAPDCDWAILVEPQGGIHVLEATGWAWAGLAAEHNSKTVYRITRERGGVRLEGRCGSETCRIESESAGQVAHRLLAGAPAAALAIPWRKPLAAWNAGETACATTRPRHLAELGGAGIRSLALWGAGETACATTPSRQLAELGEVRDAGETACATTRPQQLAEPALPGPPRCQYA